MNRASGGALEGMKEAGFVLRVPFGLCKREVFTTTERGGSSERSGGAKWVEVLGTGQFAQWQPRRPLSGGGLRSAEVVAGEEGKEEKPESKAGAKEEKGAEEEKVRVGRVDSSALLKLDSDDQDFEQRAREKKWPHKIVSIRRTAKITKAGVLNSFSAFLIVGNRNGLIGHGKGKSNDAKKAVERAYTNAMGNLIAIELFDNHTIPHNIEHRFKKTKVNLYSGKQGTGIIANELVSTICNLAGIQNLKAKVHGVHHKRNTVKAVFEALELVYSVDEVKRTRGADLRLY
ncbi:ribosomal protein S5 [Chloropicon primus]|uniref:Ribosomal protein S5 n=1 Tax=Chloropicon primus TaxID=1764295 RepID=A0A5B8MHU7_9CHLO|nr:ribosomal protein S5 [Chloropicon primus]UPQ99235.1 ribosomal protein S5 [Chloropicon primus]|eukprot:QDZ20023.1 ribosomal protein S5 [Chloropicon primus]